jgi:hypothetical protein
MTIRCFPVVSVFVALIGALPFTATAQSPRVEVGFDASARAGGATTPGVLGPHVTFNLSPDTAVEVLADLKTTRRTFGTEWSDSQSVFVQSRRIVHQTGGFRIALTGGVGAQRDQDYERIRQSAGFKTTYGPERLTERIRPMFAAGAGFEQIVSSHLAVRADLNVTFSRRGMLPRVLAGVSVPLGGRYTRSVTRAMIPDTQPLRTGQRVWIALDDDREVEGHVTAFGESTIEVRRGSATDVLRVATIRKIEVPDSIVDGTGRGAAIGGSVFAGLFGLAVAAGGCGRDCGEALLFGAMGTGFSAGIGALLGAVGDLSVNGRRTLFERGTTANVRVAPIAGRRLAGLGATIRW